MWNTLWREANAWNRISKEISSCNACHNLWPSTIFLKDDNADDKSIEFHGFCYTGKKNKYC